MKKFLAGVLTAVLFMQSIAFALTDDMIFTDPVQATYIGRGEAADIIANLQFTDVPADFWAKEAIIRGGALNLIKGYDTTFNPGGVVSNQEALAFIIRALGRENDAQQAAITIQGSLPPDSTLRNSWAIGYLNIAMQMGLITRAQYNDALVPDQTVLDPQYSFVYGNPVTREQLAAWILTGLRTRDTSAFATTGTRQRLFNFSDWDTVGVDKVEAVEAITSNRIMSGDANNRFNPKQSVTRAEMAQVLKNIGEHYYILIDVVKKAGTVGGIIDSQYNETGTGTLGRSIYVRDSAGRIDVLNRYYEDNSAPGETILDAVVFREGAASGMATLEQGDEIEYLVNQITGQVLYVQVINTNPVVIRFVEGFLQLVDVVNATITIKDSSGKLFTYPIIDGLYGNDGSKDYIFVDGAKRDIRTLPIGSRIELRLKNDVNDNIRYLGEPSVVTELRGVVIENDSDFGYLTILDNAGRELVKSYYFNDIKVEKKQYYDMTDEIGYIDQVFPDFRYDPRDSIISEIEPGDIVFIRLDPEDPSVITAISASANYIQRYGKILQFTNNGDFHQMLVEYENKQTGWFDVADGIFASKDGRPISMADVRVGDWARVLINQAVISPGYVIESAKELVIEGDEHFISQIVKGQLAGINAIQNQLLLQNAQTLTKTGWNNYKNAEKFSIAGKDIEYYYEGKRISLDYALKNLKRSNGEVYIALENNYTGDKVKKVTFRNGRDELLSAEMVVNSSGMGEFSILSNTGSIATDEGTIVRRHGRLVSGQDILIPDYAVVSLNGGNKAAVVDITDAPDVSRVMVARGRILSVDDGKSFKVQSMAALVGNGWQYTPIQREFAIDYNTLFLDGSGYVAPDTFISYTTSTVYDRVYNIIVDGSRAAYVIDAPYAPQPVRGTIYEVAGDTVRLKDVTYYEESTGKWLSASERDATAIISTTSNTIIVKNNQVTKTSALQPGDQIKVMTDTLPANPGGSMPLDGYILLVEK